MASWRGPHWWSASAPAPIVAVRRSHAYRHGGRRVQGTARRSYRSTTCSASTPHLFNATVQHIFDTEHDFFGKVSPLLSCCYGLFRSPADPLRAFVIVSAKAAYAVAGGDASAEDDGRAGGPGARWGGHPRGPPTLPSHARGDPRPSAVVDGRLVQALPAGGAQRAAPGRRAEHPAQVLDVRKAKEVRRLARLLSYDSELRPD
jgi:hypothetical protein